MKRQNTKLQKELADLKLEQRRLQQEVNKKGSVTTANVPGGMKKNPSVKNEEKFEL